MRPTSVPTTGTHEQERATDWTFAWNPGRGGELRAMGRRMRQTSNRRQQHCGRVNADLPVGASLDGRRPSLGGAGGEHHGGARAVFAARSPRAGDRRRLAREAEVGEEGDDADVAHGGGRATILHRPPDGVIPTSSRRTRRGCRGEPGPPRTYPPYSRVSPSSAPPNVCRSAVGRGAARPLQRLVGRTACSGAPQDSLLQYCSEFPAHGTE
jgi:hypothetical protein